MNVKALIGPENWSNTRSQSIVASRAQSRPGVRWQSVRRGRAGLPSGCLGDFVGSSPSLQSPPGSVVSWTASVELALFGTPQLSLLQELSMAVIRVHCRAAISQSLLFVHLFLCLSSLSISLYRSPSAGTPRSRFSGPHPDCLNPWLNSNSKDLL